MGRQSQYSRDFQLQAAKLVVEQGYTQTKAAEHLGINTWTLRDWIRKFRKDGSLPPVGEIVQEAEELKRLRKELAEIRMERDILKKAMAYFAKDNL